MLYKKKWIGWLMFLPAAFFLITFLIVPFIANVIDSFFQISKFISAETGEIMEETIFVGFQNYKPFFQGYTHAGNIQGYFYKVLANTGILILCTILVEVGFALILALLVDNIKRGKTFFRVTFFLPIIISATAIATMFVFLYNPQFVNMAAIFGVTPGSEEGYFVIFEEGKTLKPLLFVIFPIVWQYVGFYFVILLTGLAGVSGDLMEAASIDGANTWQVIFKIKIPMLWNVLRTCMVLAITGALKVYDLPAVLATGGKPGGASTTWFLGTYMNEGFLGLEAKHYRAVLAVVIVVLGVGLSNLSNLVLRENKDI